MPLFKMFRMKVLFIQACFIFFSSCVPTEECAPYLYNSVGMKLVRVPEGAFGMGAGAIPGGARPFRNEQVRIEHAFWVSVTPVTRAQWWAVMGTAPWRDRAAMGTRGEIPKGLPWWHDSQAKPESMNKPVTFISISDADAFCEALTRLDGKAGRYRLPTDEEWEYFARAGTSTRYFWGEDPNGYDDYAWVYENSSGTLHDVGQKKPNPWGLFDVYGNVDELVVNSRINSPFARGGSYTFPIIIADSNTSIILSVPPHQNSGIFAPRREHVGFRIVFDERSKTSGG